MFKKQCYFIYYLNIMHKMYNKLILLFFKYKNDSCVSCEAFSGTVWIGSLYTVLQLGTLI